MLFPLHASNSNTCDNGSERTRSRETLPNLPEEQLRFQTLQHFSNPASCPQQGLLTEEKEGSLWQKKIQLVLQQCQRPDIISHGQESIRRRSILQPFFLPFIFHGAHSSWMGWHVTQAENSIYTTKEQLQVQQSGFPTTPFSLGSLHLTFQTPLTLSGTQYATHTSLSNRKFTWRILKADVYKMTDCRYNVISGNT